MSAPWIALAMGAAILAILLYVREWRARVAATTHAEQLEKTTQRSVEELAVALRLTTQLSEVLDVETLKQTLKAELPQIIGTDDFWVAAQLKEWTVVVGDAGDSAGPLPLGMMDRSEAWECFPLGSPGKSSGLLGVKQPSVPFSEVQRELMGTVATLIGVTVRNMRRFTLARDLSMIDWLTRCLTRWYGVDALSREMRRQRRSRHSLCVAMLDLDHFKAINDQYGHHAGDRVLSSVGRAMKESLRVSDIACRYGGDEFLVILPETSLAGAVRAIENLRTRIDKAVDVPEPDQLRMTTSVGITEVGLDEEDPDGVIRRADLAMYEAKRSGRNRVAVTRAPGGPQNSVRTNNPPNDVSVT
jgi:diguanylate cyclase (GGDEF)-like protein